MFMPWQIHTHTETLRCEKISCLSWSRMRNFCFNIYRNKNCWNRDQQRERARDRERKKGKNFLKEICYYLLNLFFFFFFLHVRKLRWKLKLTGATNQNMPMRNFQQYRWRKVLCSESKKTNIYLGILAFVFSMLFLFTLFGMTMMNFVMVVHCILTLFLKCKNDDRCHCCFV